MLQVVAGYCKAWEFCNTLSFQTSIWSKWERRDPFLPLYFKGIPWSYSERGVVKNSSTVFSSAESTSSICCTVEADEENVLKSLQQWAEYIIRWAVRSQHLVNLVVIRKELLWRLDCSLAVGMQLSLVCWKHTSPLHRTSLEMTSAAQYLCSFNSVHMGVDPVKTDQGHCH